jgi:hypothetical protein
VTDTNSQALVNQQLSATNQFTVTVNEVNSAPVLVRLSMISGNEIRLNIVGDAGHTYTVLVSSNLLHWQELRTFTNVIVTPFNCVDRMEPGAETRFYRVFRE